MFPKLKYKIIIFNFLSSIRIKYPMISDIDSINLRYYVLGFCYFFISFCNFNFDL